MKQRWQAAVHTAIRKYTIVMPWQRGKPRQAMIARRTAEAIEFGKDSPTKNGAFDF
ncbi:hypothetical protein [Loktanella sp. S4079]|uniref:hypothetical protein n=1 Tax=Loktanella sp. S4079 TaxID=579483 RepID=UPI000ABA3A17|nr:hypothetical protein [Loktanella sp. S4079]